MNEERRKILDMLSAGKITSEEADRLLAALAITSADTPPDPKLSPKGKPRWLHIELLPPEGDGDGDRIHLKVPLLLLRTGLKLGSLIPVPMQARMVAVLGNQGYTVNLSDMLNKMTPDELIDALSESQLDLNSEGDRIRIYCA